MNGLHVGAALMLASLVSPAAAQSVAQSVPQTITLQDDGHGKRFEGIGVVDGGGATSVLLKDYPEPQRSQILDLLYKPHFGASVSALYVEIPGDGNSTQGSMPSHMHDRDDLDYRRGYTWWVMQEARRRNNSISLDGAAWSAPGWLGASGALYPQSLGKDYEGDARFFSQDTVDYYITWLRGLRQVYGLELDAIGIRNEKGASYGFAQALRTGLNGHGFAKVRLHAFDNWPDPWKFKFVPDMVKDRALRDSIDIIGAHINAPQSVVPADIQPAARDMGKPIWNTEQHVYKAGFDGLIGIVEAFNENYIRSGVTKIVNWYGIASLYEMEPYSGVKEAGLRANWPWSGHFEINPSLWGYAHYGQFTAQGWQYLTGGSGDLGGGGTFVTLKSPADDYSIIVETKDASRAQRVDFAIGTGLSQSSLAVWRSDRDEQFVREADITPRDGKVSITLNPNSVYSLTTTRGQRKGTFPEVSEKAAFPFPYLESFDGYGAAESWGYLPHYFADISGAFELSPCPARPGGCLRQKAPRPTISWAPDWLPYTIIGDDQWHDYQVDADVYLGDGESAAVMGRINDTGTGYGFIPKGYVLRLDASGDLRLSVVRGKADKKKLVGDAEQQALIKAQNDMSEGGEKLLATQHVSGVGARQWHTVSLRFAGTSITGFVDGRQILQADDGLYAHGMAGLLAGAAGTKLSMPYFDNVAITSIGTPTPAPATKRRWTPIYASGKRS
ncbi:hypothetical protein Q4F19_11160 [Sphingomonas sp. BIUV-7]|uniref:galactosylceramidase n=1 Tax=Sphingomonas natans TaxID=3063330 RepID=A0ABT8Y9D2_9SPHN|nr:hypothetical protein [Sphingomonas sp. BIUV-7]MDO6414941.1 hypothetical protein [Sphingomonas sp. BIUV-7]